MSTPPLITLCLLRSLISCSSLAKHIVKLITKRALQALIMCVLTLSASLKSSAETPHDEPPNVASPLKSLLSQPSVLALASAPLWRQLLHYEDSLWGAKSRSDGSRFFLSAERTPLAELKADLQALLSGRTSAPNEHFSCLFPARSTWLLARLNELKSKGALQGVHQETLALSPPQVSCPKRDEFLQKMDIHGLELLYASASFKQSASMFGHTMIRVLRGPERDPIEDPVISFVAHVTVGGILETIYGLTGQFMGIIEVSNLSQRIINYTVLERRHLWGLKLKVPQEGLRRFVEHLWEMNSTFFNYHFFDENCAFYNQTLLQLALPDRPLRDEMSLISLPLESVHALARHDGLIESVSFYPSAQTSYESGWRALSSHERDLVARIATRPAAVELPAERAALVYKTALNLNLMTHYQTTLKIPQEARDQGEALSKLLSATGLNPQLMRPDHTSPLVGSGPHSVAIAGGLTQPSTQPSAHGMSELLGGASFIDLEWRPMLHERYDNPLSYERYNEIVLLKTRARYLPSEHKLTLNQLTLASLYNFRVWTLTRAFTQTPLSWAFDLGVRDAARFQRSGTDAYFELEWGLTLPLAQLGALSWMLGPLVEGGIKGEGWRAGAHSFAQLALYPHDRWSVNMRAGARLFEGWASLLPNPAQTLTQSEAYAEGYINLFINPNLSFNLIGKATHLAPASLNAELGVELRAHWF